MRCGKLNVATDIGHKIEVESVKVGSLIAAVTWEQKMRYYMFSRSLVMMNMIMNRLVQ